MLTRIGILKNMMKKLEKRSGFLKKQDYIEKIDKEEKI